MPEDTTADTHAHQPAAVEEPGESTAATREETAEPKTASEAEADEARNAGLSTAEGWLVAGALAVLLVGAPVVVYLWPPGFLGFRDAYLVVAMVPGFLLGVLGLWAARAS